MEFRQIYEQAEKHYQKGQFQEAISFLEKHIQKGLQPLEKMEFLYLLGKYKAALLKDESARLPVQQGLEIAKKSGKKELEKKGTLLLEKISGDISIHLGKNQDAAKAYDRARKIAKESALEADEIDLLIRESKAYFYLGDDSRVRELLETALKKAEKSKDGKFLSTIFGDLGDLALRGGESQEAYQYYEKALGMAEKNKEELEKAESLARLGKWHFYRGNTENALEMLSRAIHLSRDLGNLSGQIEALGTVGKIHFFMGENEEAKAAYQKALDLARQSKDMLGEQSNLGNLGNVHMRLGHMDEALESFKEGLRMAREMEDAQAEMNALGWIGDAYYQKGENIKALNHYYKALEMAKRLASALGESSNLSRIGDIYFSRYENDTAFQKYSEALELARKANSPPAILNNLISLGDLYHRKGEDDQALKHYEEALLIAHELNTPQGMLNSIQSLGEVYLRRGREDEALLRFRQALGLSRKLEDPVAEIVSLRGIGEVFFRQGDYTKANAHYKKALEMAQKIKDPLEELIQKSKIGNVYLKKGKRELAQKYFSEAYELARKYDSPEGLLATLMALGIFDVEQGSLDEGAKKLNEAVALAERLDEPLEKVRALSLLGWIAIQQGSFSEALKHYQQTTLLLEPIASGDIQEESVSPELSKQERLERLKSRVAEAAQEAASFSPAPSPQKLEEDTGEFEALSSYKGAGETGEYEAPMETHFEEPSPTKKTLSLPGLAAGEDKKIQRQCWKALEEGLVSQNIDQVLHTVIALRKMKDRKVLPLLEKAYGSYKKENEILNHIIRAFEDFPGKDSGPTLSRLFREEERVELKISLAESLAKQGHLGGVDFLLALSQQKNPYQKRGVESLGNSGQKEVLPSLQELLKKSTQDERLYTAILTALLALGDLSAEQKLMDALNSEDITNMFFTARALARAGSASALISLESIVETIIEKKKPSLEEFSILQRSVEERLLTGGGNMKSFLQNAYGFKPLRASLFLMLDEDSASFLEKELGETLHSDERWESRAGAAHALGYTNHEKVFPPLKKVFYHDDSIPVRMAAGGSLMRILARMEG